MINKLYDYDTAPLFAKIFWLLRQAVRALGVISLYYVCATIIYLTMDIKPGQAVLQVDKIIGREVSPDGSWVALTDYRFRFEDLLFNITITDTVWLVKTSEEGQFRHDISQKYHVESGVLTRYSRINLIKDRPLARWLSPNQLYITAPVNANGSYILLSKQTIDGINVLFSFEDNERDMQRRNAVVQSGRPSLW